jgi:hypothetical protein
VDVAVNQGMKRLEMFEFVNFSLKLAAGSVAVVCTYPFFLLFFHFIFPISRSFRSGGLERLQAS